MKSKFNDPFTNFIVKNTVIPSSLLTFEIYTRLFYKASTLLSLILFSVIFLYYIIFFISMKISSKEEQEQYKNDENRKTAENKASKWTLLPLMIIMLICSDVFSFIGQEIAGIIIRLLTMLSVILFSILNMVFLHKNKKDTDLKDDEQKQYKNDENQKTAVLKSSKWTLFPLLLVMTICLLVFPFIGQEFAGFVLLCLTMLSLILFSILSTAFYHKNKKTHI